MSGSELSYAKINDDILDEDEMDEHEPKMASLIASNELTSLRFRFKYLVTGCFVLDVFLDFASS